MDIDKCEVDVPFNWRNVLQKNIDTGFVGRSIVKREQTDQELLMFFNPNTDKSLIREVRDWLQENMKDRFKMFGRFSYRARVFKTDCEYKGVAFVFDDFTDMILFKFRWYNGSVPNITE